MRTPAARTGRATSPTRSSRTQGHTNSQTETSPNLQHDAHTCGVLFFFFWLMLLLKLQVDLSAKKAKTWYEDGAMPSEPLFVARPSATREDDG